MIRLFLLFISLMLGCHASLADIHVNTQATKSTRCVIHHHPRGGDASSAVINKIIAGGISRGLAQALLYPIDALRTLAQTRDGRTLADVGSQALLRGAAQTSSFALFTGALQFGIFGAVQPQYGALVASACGAAGSCIVSVPQEVIKQRLVTGVYSSFREAIKSIWKNEGVLGFYSGWRPTMSRNVPFVVTTFTSRDLLRDRLLKWKELQTNNGKTTLLVKVSAMENLAVGITSALIAGVVTQPIDVVKTRMMTQAASTATPYTSAVDCALTVVRTEGWRKLYSGFGQRSVYMCGLWGITFAMEPIMFKYLNERNTHQ
ncbi:predicted protein [Thalassiosira pseudonana CCMP1335]|uniref:Mitochondrial carrier protein n=1 Tax=Thalassiosira pseudonana TaxID=35128 RepID=B8BU08_THAPS|nr:predicted protein [Thalassiosira pseudonana CCMP1335]EED94682.1 predicted protein [Thalassiosira pseudonana CCMP1335]|eukprot:g10532.t1 g10532   contig4:2057684-2058717(-)